jgi:hypothetical protein
MQTPAVFSISAFESDKKGEQAQCWKKKPDSLHWAWRRKRKLDLLFKK